MAKDNSSLKFKVWQRREVAQELASAGQTPIVLDAFAGFGVVFGRAWREFKPRGAALDQDRKKCEHLARQRPDWIIARGDNAALVAAKFCDWLPFNVLDADAYGSPWEVVKAFLESERQRADPFYIVATDGLGYKLALSGKVKILKPFVEKYGESFVRRNYKEIAREILESFAGSRSSGCTFTIKDWRFHAGANKLAHWTARLSTA